MRAYDVPIAGRVEGNTPEPQPLAEIGRGYQALEQTGIAALNEVLARSSGRELDTYLGGAWLDLAGDLLFEALLGPDERRWMPVIREAMALRNEAPNPIRAPLRIRILTDVPELLGLPWRITQWKGHLLRDYDWTFEVSRERQPATRVDYRSPGRVLVIAPPEPTSLAGPAGPPIEVERHVEEIEVLLDNLSPDFTRSDNFRVARSREELEAALGWLAPDLVYFYGHGDAPDSKPQLRLGDGPEEWLQLRDFAHLIRDRPPRAVFLNGCWTGQGSWHGAGFQLLPRVPLVIANSTAVGAESARRYVLDWLEAWLGRGQDPVAAAHVRPTETKLLSRWATAVVYANYDTWTTSRPTGGRVRVDRCESWLDRDSQRAIAHKHVADLVRHERQRVEAIVIYAEPGNAIERVPQQIIDYIERESGDRIHMHRVVVRFPDAGGSDLDAPRFEQGLKARLEVDPRTDLERALAAKAPLPKGEVARVLWLDWGVLRGRAAYGDDVGAWLNFARDRLATTPFEGFRVVASLALEADGRAFEALKKGLPRLRSTREYWTDRFRCTAVEPLAGANEADLLAFLEAHGCDPGDVRQLADAIFTKTAGRYDETTELLREGLRLGWRVLLARLSAAPAPNPLAF